MYLSSIALVNVDCSSRTCVSLSWHSTTPTRTPTPTPTRQTRLQSYDEITCVGRKIVAVFGESVSVSVSVPASWNASITSVSCRQQLSSVQQSCCAIPQRISRTCAAAAAAAAVHYAL